MATTFFQSLSRSWVVNKAQATGWYYARRFSLPFGARSPLRLRVRGPEWTSTVELEIRGQEDIFQALKLFTDDNAWNRLPAMSPPPETVVDLGANIGYSSLFWKMRYPQARVVGVEMDAGNFARCQRLFASNRLEDHFVHGAVGSRNGTLSYRSHQSHTRNRLSELVERDAAGENGAYGSTQREVESLTFNTLLDRNNLPRVDPLKVDIEGAEQFLLDSIGEWAGRVSMLLEIHHNIDPDEARRAVEGAGFENFGGDSYNRTEWWCVNRRV